MGDGDFVDDSEEVVRGFLFPYWDQDNQRATLSAFEKKQVSVSRLAVLSLKDIVRILRADFDHRAAPTGESLKVRAVGIAQVADVIAQTKDPVGQGKKAMLPPAVLTVTEHPIKDVPGYADNPAHALICAWQRDRPDKERRIPPSVANRLLKLFRVQILQE